MSRYLDPAIQTMMEQRALVARDYVWITARDRESGAPVTDGMWSDYGAINSPVTNPFTGLTSYRPFYGTGTLVEVTAIPLVTGLSVQPVSIKMSQVNDRVEQLVRLYDPQQGRIEIYRGIFDPETRILVAPAFARFVGFIDKITIVTPEEGGLGHVEFECKSHTQELTRSNPDTRSDESQKQRLATDTFYKDSSVAGEWEIFWGSIKGKVPGVKKKKFLGIF